VTNEDENALEQWNVLVVDDEEDVHEVTRLALKRKTWRNYPIKLTSAYSAAEAKELLAKRPDFHVALVDVVMETDEAGLQLCRYIRAQCPRSLRVILRTGQPGVAPPEVVLNDYDIDYYLAKPDVTVDRLYGVVRACLRSSQDIATLLAFGKQIQNFTVALQNLSSLNDLLVFMSEGLRFLELKHAVRTIFFHDVSDEAARAMLSRSGTGKVPQADQEGARVALKRAHEQGVKELELVAGKELRLAEDVFVMVFSAKPGAPGLPLPQSEDAAPEQVIKGGLYVTPKIGSFTSRNPEEFRADARLFVENWRIAHGALRLQERIAREQMLREKMYFERMSGIATMVAGVAHEINTPLGVANTANSTIVNRLQTLIKEKPTDADTLNDIFEDLQLASDLLTKNLVRANGLISSFKKLSASQLADNRETVDLGILLNDCVQTMSPETKKKKIAVRVDRSPGTQFTWEGYPSHLTQVIVNFFQNAIRYAYHNRPDGVIDIRLSAFANEDQPSYRIEFEDYGAGVDPATLKKLFQPFVTTGRDRGGTGLGLAIVHNIVTNLLKGRILCVSNPGKGTKFTVELPTRVPEKAPAVPQ
jgi:signal transduction histidine kinase/DNA-binding response OmpR family regulator